MKLPQRLDNDPKSKLQTDKTLCLKQILRAWNALFNNFIKRLGFKHSEHDSCFYMRFKNDVKTFLLLYVDIIIASNSKNELKVVKTSLGKKFYMTDLSMVSYFLGIRIIKTKDGIILLQSSYLQNLLK